MNLFFFVATVAMISEKLPFSNFLCNHCCGNKFLHENNVAHQSKLSLEKRNQKDRESSGNICLTYCNDADCCS